MSSASPPLQQSPPAQAPAPKLSTELARLRARLGTRPVTLREVTVTLRGRAYVLIIILFSLPFVVPIPLPGVSTPLGAAIGFIALRMALGRRPWLPAKWQRRELPAGFFQKTFALAERVIRWLEALLRPRLLWVVGEPAGAQRLHSLVIVLAALILLLPLPIPFSNTLPAWAILLIAAGVLERDGLAILLGHVAFVLGGLYLLLLGTAAQQLGQSFWHWLNA
ncbi:hypothetical protein AXK11_08860 [Cephaloticoccus primus]|uniref:Exopolysaccharide biosynthesis protein exod n=1 Tax=Cephaloticoccus primus TaxID=1548207 RepID=A0A139SHY9_9BACT|nr:exopolysaccharide biosynthesis protein [Cephaloticoccus primus]KXU34143.1 hypothetical protein AXK11_08860 [Cephaloticoccus primus]